MLLVWNNLLHLDGPANRDHQILAPHAGRGIPISQGSRRPGSVPGSFYVPECFKGNKKQDIDLERERKLSSARNNKAIIFCSLHFSPQWSLNKDSARSARLMRMKWKPFPCVGKRITKHTSLFLKFAQSVLSTAYPGRSGSRNNSTSTTRSLFFNKVKIVCLAFGKNIAEFTKLERLCICSCSLLYHDTKAQGGQRLYEGVNCIAQNSCKLRQQKIF